MRKQEEIIRAIGQAIDELQREHRSAYNRTIYVNAKQVANNAIRVDFSTAVQLNAHPHFTPRTPREKEEAIHDITQRTVQMARQVVANDYLPELKERAEAALDRQGSTTLDVNGDEAPITLSGVTFDLLENSEKWHVETIKQFNRSDMAQFKYHATFLFDA